MSIRRFNMIAVRFIQEVFYRVSVKIAGKAAVNTVLKNISPQIFGKRAWQGVNFRRAMMRGLRHSRQLRPFAPLASRRQRANELDQWRLRRGPLLHLPRRGDGQSAIDRVRHIFGTNARYNRALAVTEMPNFLDGYEIGDHIATGCNGTVYALRLQSEANGTKEKRPFGVLEEEEEKATQNRQDGMAESTFVRFPLALKIMFNYNVGAPEHWLWREMGNELIPLGPGAAEKSGGYLLHGGRMASISKLPVRPHPNLIKMHTAFVDRMPVLPGADKLYPAALSFAQQQQMTQLVDRDRVGQDKMEMNRLPPKTLFVVMKRYRMTLFDYVHSHKRNYWIGRVLFGQLLESVVFLRQHRIAHRDIKSDNILLDFDHDEDVPHLVLSDFGSALASGAWDVFYRDDSVDLGGNLALRAPEIRCARPGPGKVVNFEMADTWAAGTMAFEIFTRRNPFYAVLSSESYRESDLPPLPARIVEPVRRAVAGLLKRAPSERLRPEIAANVVALSLFRFGQDVCSFLRSLGLDLGSLVRSLGLQKQSASQANDETDSKLQEMMKLYAAETILSRLIHPGVVSSAELQFRATFLSRLDKGQLRTALLDFFFFDQQDGPPSAPVDEDGFPLFAHSSAVAQSYSSAEMFHSPS